MLRALVFCSVVLLAVGADEDDLGLLLLDEASAAGTRGEYTKQEIGAGKMWPNGRVWDDMPESAWRTVPEWLENVEMGLPKGKMKGRGKFFWHCKPGLGQPQPTRCEVYVFVYSCKGCVFATGNLHPALLAHGFKMFRCPSPRLVTRVGGAAHHMLGFVKSIEPGVRFELPFDGPDVEFVTFGMNKYPTVSCVARSEVACKVSQGKCTWDEANNSCVLRTCGGRSGGSGGSGGGGFGPGSSGGDRCSEKCLNDDLP